MLLRPANAGGALRNGIGMRGDLMRTGWIRHGGRATGLRFGGYVCASMLAFAGAAAAGPTALLIGIDRYGNGLPVLSAAVHDVQSLRQVLGAHGFAAEDIEVLTDAGATRQAILDALERLALRSRAGDPVLFHFSGLATAVSSDNAAAAELPEALLPVDADRSLQTRIRSATDLLPRLEKLAASGHPVLAILDAGTADDGRRGRLRSAIEAGSLPSRGLALAPGSPKPAPQVDAESDLPLLCERDCEAASWVRSGLNVLTAASPGEAAREIDAAALARLPTRDLLPHGALSDALLRALAGAHTDRDRDGRLSSQELHDAVSQRLQQLGLPQAPLLLPRLDAGRGRPDAGFGLPVSGRPMTEDRVDNRLRVRLDPPAQVRLAALLDTEPGLQRVDGQADVSIRQHGASWLLIGAAGDLLASLPDDGGLRVRAALRRQAWAQALLAVPATAGGRLDLEAGGEVRGVVALAGQQLRVLLRASRTMQVLLLDVQPDGGVQVLYPAPDLPKELQPLAEGMVHAVPDTGTPPATIGPPFGTDRLLAFGFPAPGPEVPKLAGRYFAPDADLSALTALLRDPALVRAGLTLVTVPASTQAGAAQPPAGSRVPATAMIERFLAVVTGSALPPAVPAAAEAVNDPGSSADVPSRQPLN